MIDIVVLTDILVAVSVLGWLVAAVILIWLFWG